MAIDDKCTLYYETEDMSYLRSLVTKHNLFSNGEFDNFKQILSFLERHYGFELKGFDYEQSSNHNASGRT